MISKVSTDSNYSCFVGEIHETLRVTHAVYRVVDEIVRWCTPSIDR